VGPFPLPGAGPLALVQVPWGCRVTRSRWLCPPVPPQRNDCPQPGGRLAMAGRVPAHAGRVGRPMPGGVGGRGRTVRSRVGGRGCRLSGGGGGESRSQAGWVGAEWLPEASRAGLRAAAQVVARSRAGRVRPTTYPQPGSQSVSQSVSQPGGRAERGRCRARGRDGGHGREGWWPSARRLLLPWPSVISPPGSPSPGRSPPRPSASCGGSVPFGTGGPGPGSGGFPGLLRRGPPSARSGSGPCGG